MTDIDKIYIHISKQCYNAKELCLPSTYLLRFSTHEEILIFAKKKTRCTFVCIYNLTRLTWLIHTSVLPSIWNPDKIFAPTGLLGQVHIVKKIFLKFLHAGSWSFLLLNLWFSSKLLSKMNIFEIPPCGKLVIFVTEFVIFLKSTK